MVGVPNRNVNQEIDHLRASDLLGLSVTWATPGTIAAALRPDTALVVIETPANPTAALVDIAGVVATDAAWAARLRQVRLMTGGLLHPLAAYLLHRGLPTLPLRVERAQASARILAERLAAHPEVERVFYPGLPGGDPAGLLGRQMAGPGSIFAFELVGGTGAADRLLEELSLVTHAVSLGSTDTLIQRPAALTHHIMTPAERAAAGIPDALLRVSVGLEHPEDLWNDFERALGSVAGAWSVGVEGDVRCGQVVRP